jgi:hypothetical protein
MANLSLRVAVYGMQVAAIIFADRIGLRRAFDLLVVSILVSNTFLWPAALNARAARVEDARK